jgi:dTDP-4-dehydrorhamnose reductase
MKVLITGAGGMTGSELVRQARERQWSVAAFDHDDLDIIDGSEVDAVVAREKPDIVFNAAAYTAVDAAESESELAMAVNAAGAGNVACAAHTHGAAIVHISTDYVFSGEASEPYQPGDRVAPVNAYGESKLAGEIAVTEACDRHVIVRTSWVYSHEGKNFVRTMLRAAEEGRELRVVNDQHGCPTSSADLAAALIGVAEQIEESGVNGTYHFCNSGTTTWFDFANAIFDLRGGTKPAITPVSSAEFPTEAKRPAWSVLDTTSFQKTFGITPRPWRDALRDTLSRLT